MIKKLTRIVKNLIIFSIVMFAYVSISLCLSVILLAGNFTLSFFSDTACTYFVNLMNRIWFEFTCTAFLYFFSNNYYYSIDQKSQEIIQKFKDGNSVEKGIIGYANHVTEYDWYFLFSIFKELELYEYCHIVVKRELEKIWVIGRVMKIVGCIFFERDIKKDKAVIEKHMKDLVEKKFFAFLFVEGTYLTKESIKRSNEFCEKIYAEHRQKNAGKSESVSILNSSKISSNTYTNESNILGDNPQASFLDSEYTYPEKKQENINKELTIEPANDNISCDSHEKERYNKENNESLNTYNHEKIHYKNVLYPRITGFNLMHSRAFNELCGTLQFTCLINENENKELPYKWFTLTSRFFNFLDKEDLKINFIVDFKNKEEAEDKNFLIKSFHEIDATLGKHKKYTKSCKNVEEFSEKIYEITEKEEGYYQTLKVDFFNKYTYVCTGIFILFYVLLFYICFPKTFICVIYNCFEYISIIIDRLANCISQYCNSI